MLKLSKFFNVFLKYVERANTFFIFPSTKKHLIASLKVSQNAIPVRFYVELFDFLFYKLQNYVDLFNFLQHIYRIC